MGKRYIHLFYIILTSEIAGNDLLQSCDRMLPFLFSFALYLYF